MAHLGEAMTVDQTINAWLAPIADWLGKVVFFTVPLAGADLPLIVVWLIVGGIVLHGGIPLHQSARLPAFRAGYPRRLLEA
jgi:hypothetical protein